MNSTTVAHSPATTRRSLPADGLFGILRARRGWTDEFLARLEDTDVPPLKDAAEAVAILHGVQQAGEQVVVYPDFDMDGISSGVLGLAGLAELGFNVGMHIPDYRIGHGVPASEIDRLIAEHPRAACVVTCDVGITAHEGVDHAVERGLKVIVTDHHIESEGRVRAHAVVDPARADEDYPNEGLCGANVLWKLLDAYARTHRPDKVSAIAQLRLFAGIGTVADVMPLVGENRQLVRDSLSLARLLYVRRAWNDDAPVDIESCTLLPALRAEQHHPLFVSAFEGMAVMLAAFIERGKLRSDADLDNQFYGYYLAPAFNAIRRIGTDIRTAFDVFFAPGPEAKRACAEKVLEDNDLRKQMVLEHTEAIAAREQPHGPHVVLSSAPTGMLGLLANQLMRSAGHPVVVVRAPEPDPETGEVRWPVDQRAGGSARSPLWFDVNQTVNDHGDGWIAAGHAHACGVSVPSPDQLGELSRVLAERSEQELARLEASGELAAMETPDLRLGDYDGCDWPIYDFEAVFDLLRDLESLRPFGHGFDAPRIELITDLADARFKVMGSEAQHLAVTISEGVKCLWWNQAQRMEELEEIGRAEDVDASLVRVRGRFSENFFMGRTSLDFIVDEIVPVVRTATGR